MRVQVDSMLRTVKNAATRGENCREVKCIATKWTHWGESVKPALVQ